MADKQTISGYEFSHVGVGLEAADSADGSHILLRVATVKSEPSASGKMNLYAKTAGGFSDLVTRASGPIRGNINIGVRNAK